MEIGGYKMSFSGVQDLLSQFLQMFTLNVVFMLPSSQFLHLSVLFFLQLGDETLKDRHLKLDILCHLEERGKPLME